MMGQKKSNNFNYLQMTMKSASKKWKKFISEERAKPGIKKFLGWDQIVAHKRSLRRAYENCVMKGECTRTDAVIDVMPIPGEKDKYQLCDGYHRFILSLFRKEDSGIVNIDISDWAQGRYGIAKPDERWYFDDDKEWKGLEDIPEEGTDLPNDYKHLQDKGTIQ
tara:strand:+ start:1240 stop:1731 length:492 start_codon:yes stop_codon:yes gene_type:complete